ncbi:MAG: sigma factor-like helix-turn-helix DNA-binding protein [Polyangiales bacterium]
MVLSLERDQRISFILAEIFELSSDDAAAVLDIAPAAHRKRLSRAREKLAGWMGKHCGLANIANACRCARQIPVATGAGVVDGDDIHYATHPERAEPRRHLPISVEASEIEAAAFALKNHPDYAAPASVLAQIRGIIDSGRYRMFDA